MNFDKLFLKIVLSIKSSQIFVNKNSNLIYDSLGVSITYTL